MKEKFLSSSIAYITKYNEQYTEKEEMKKLRYGLEGLYITITKLVIIILLSYILGILKEVLAVLLLFNIIRYTGFGFHAAKSSECLIFSTTLFVVLPYLLLNITINKYIFIIVSAICIISYMLYAPADTKKRPLTNKKKRIARKISTILIGIIYLLIALIVNNQTFTTIVLTTLITQMIIILPITYKLFRQPYNNYKSYKTA